MIIKVGIIESSRAASVELVRNLDRDYRFKLCFILHNSNDSVRHIVESDPDVLLLSYESGENGSISILKELGLGPKTSRPYVIVTSEFYNEILAQHLSSYGVSDFILKPYEVTDVMEKLVNVYRYYTMRREPIARYKLGQSDFRGMHILKESAAAVYIRDEMTEVSGICYDLLTNSHFNTNLKGFAHIISAIKLLYSVNDTEVSVTKELYPTISNATMCSPATIERNMRTAISRAWTRHCSLSYAGSISSYDLFCSFSDRPGNYEFLRYLTFCVRVIIGSERRTT